MKHIPEEDMKYFPGLKFVMEFEYQGDSWLYVEYDLRIEIWTCDGDIIATLWCEDSLSERTVTEIIRVCKQKYQQGVDNGMAQKARQIRDALDIRVPGELPR